MMFDGVTKYTRSAVMTGKAFLKMVTHKGIPLSCIAVRLNCKLATIKAIGFMETVPKPYIVKFISAFRDSLTDHDVQALTN